VASAEACTSLRHPANV